MELGQTGRQRAAAAWGPALVLALVLAGLGLAPSARGGAIPEAGALVGEAAGGPEGGPAAGAALIRAEDAAADVAALAHPGLEGRDTPSLGLDRAAGYISGRLAAVGYRGLGPDGSMLWPFERRVPVPEPAACALVRADEAGEARQAYGLGRDFVPLWGSGGRASGATVFVGFGIRHETERFDELSGRELRERVAVLVEGEPEHPERFAGPEVSAAANLYAKLDALDHAGVVGVLVVRRQPHQPLAFRHGWADWHRHRADKVRTLDLPVLEVTPAVARDLFDADVLEWAREIEESGRAHTASGPGAWVELSAGTRVAPVAVHNVVAWLPGRDPERSAEFVVLGAHHDHLGVDPRGRVGLGADDNASGVAALLEVAEALAAARPARSVLVCAFAGEEDGLLGSRALLRDPPVPLQDMVAMLNLDMLGRGARDEVAVIGLLHNPELEAVLERARALAPTGVERLVLRQGQELFERSDHFPFHQAGVPALFFFEGLPITRNADYHTWRDTPEKVDAEKVAATARLAFHTAWILAEDPGRPPRPER